MPLTPRDLDDERFIDYLQGWPPAAQPISPLRTRAPDA
jgi:hypothetical protein